VTGLADPDDIRKAIRPDTRLIAVTHASNVSGTVQPIRQIGAIAREHGIPFIVDAAQSAGHIPIDIEADHIDLLAAPGHKGLLGPLGTGFLYIRPGLENTLATLKEGGTGSVSEQDRQPEFMPDKYEPGSNNAIGIIGLLEGVKWVAAHTVEKLAEHDRLLSRTFLDSIKGTDGVACYGPHNLHHRTSVFSIRVHDLKPYELAQILENNYGVLTRPGLHCAPGAHRAFGTLEGGGTTRFSFGPFLQQEEVAYAAAAVKEIAKEHMSPRHFAISGTP
jgi:selenocysteine lyase/cysteine desulfurase